MFSFRNFTGDLGYCGLAYGGLNMLQSRSTVYISMKIYLSTVNIWRNQRGLVCNGHRSNVWKKHKYFCLPTLGKWDGYSDVHCTVHACGQLSFDRVSTVPHTVPHHLPLHSSVWLLDNDTHQKTQTICLPRYLLLFVYPLMPWEILIGPLMRDSHWSPFWTSLIQIWKTKAYIWKELSFQNVSFLNQWTLPVLSWLFTLLVLFVVQLFHIWLIKTMPSKPFNQKNQ